MRRRGPQQALLALAAAALAVASAGVAGHGRAAGRGAALGAPAAPAALGERLLFALDDGVHGLELWRTESDGSTRPVADLRSRTAARCCSRRWTRITATSCGAATARHPARSAWPTSAPARPAHSRTG